MVKVTSILSIFLLKELANAHPMPGNNQQFRELKKVFQHNYQNADIYQKNMHDIYNVDYEFAKVNKDPIGRLSSASKIYLTSGPIGKQVHKFGRALQKTVAGISFH